MIDDARRKVLLKRGCTQPMSFFIVAFKGMDHGILEDWLLGLSKQVKFVLGVLMSLNMFLVPTLYHVTSCFRKMLFLGI